MRIDEYISFLEVEDANFSKVWRNKSPQEKGIYITRWEKLNDLTDRYDYNTLEEKNLNAYLATCKNMSLIQEKSFSTLSVPKHWKIKVNSATHLKLIYQRNKDLLQEVIAKQNGQVVNFYGGLKSYEEIRRKFFLQKNGSALQRNAEDLWDLVRYRIVVDNLESLLQTGMYIWKNFFNKIIRCRNYYYIPRTRDPRDAYRAIHFQIVDDEEGMFELQLVTVQREAISLLDHALVFKKTIQSYDKKTIKWLSKMSYASNIIEYKNANDIAIDLRWD